MDSRSWSPLGVCGGRLGCGGQRFFMGDQSHKTCEDLSITSNLVNVIPGLECECGKWGVKAVEDSAFLWGMKVTRVEHLSLSVISNFVND